VLHAKICPIWAPFTPPERKNVSYSQKSVPLFPESARLPESGQSGLRSWPKMCLFRLFWTAFLRPDRTSDHENEKKACFGPLILIFLRRITRGLLKRKRIFPAQTHIGFKRPGILLSVSRITAKRLTRSEQKFSIRMQKSPSCPLDPHLGHHHIQFCT
jgi:hypothetical protein